MSSGKPIVSANFSYETLEETLDVKPQGLPLFIGIPKETDFQENRISLSPDAVAVLTNNGHRVVVEHTAGEGAHFSDKDYSEAGATLVYDKKEVYQCGIIIKSAPVSDLELEFLKPNHQLVFSISASRVKY